VDTRIHLAANVIVGLQENLEIARKVFFSKERGGLREARPLIGSGGDEVGIGSADTRDQEIAHVANRFAAEVLKVAAFPLEAMDEAEGA